MKIEEFHLTLKPQHTHVALPLFIHHGQWYGADGRKGRQLGITFLWFHVFVQWETHPPGTVAFKKRVA